ncbi:MAG: type II secretion system protein GspE, partial [Proteobacteria bacterium]
STSGMSNFDVHDIDVSLESGGAGDSSGEAVVNFVNGILGEAVRRGASDIHVEPYERRFRVRLRVDGSLLEIAEVPPELKRTVVARLKIMSRMDISESRIPQDGRIKIKVGGQMVDFRVNSLPTLFGEKVVLRILSQGNLNLDLTKLGFEEKQLEVFKKGIYAPNGMVLVTGPTGSGKTTTLYSALAELNKSVDNISTAEDPVEYNLEGINQTQINKDVGMNFASVLRAMLRQDPDIILVGEIRDYETAEVSIQAALTGHLVLSTLHTNDAPSSITRLMNMGVEPFLVTSSVNTIVAQRLLRKICPKCRVEFAIPKEKLVELGAKPEQLATMKLYHGKGCSNCANTGYKGRLAIYEVFEFTQDLKEMVLRGQTIIEIRKAAVSAGMKSLRESAISKVFEGQTSLQEAISMTME